MAQNRITWRKRLLYTDQPVRDDASRVKTVLNNVILHIHPTQVQASALRFTYTWGLGGISATLATILAFTGVLLMFRYDATVDKAYMSIQLLETQVIFGSLVRALHHWSANLLVITSFLHLLRVAFTGGYKSGRTMNWLIGIILMIIVLAFNFTGYLLPWDQLAFWAITVSTSLFSYIPLIGEEIGRFFLGGSEVGQGALRNFYALHVAVLPVSLVLTMSYHFWKIRKNGGISQPIPKQRTRIERVTTIPNLVRIEFAAAAVVIAGIILFAMFVPAPLEDIADPTHSPNPAKAGWYFLGFQELLLHLHPAAAILLVGSVVLGITLLPYLDRRSDDIGIYFRSKIGKRSALVGAFLAIDLVPLIVFADEYWIDWSALLTQAPLFITTGAIPLGLTFLIFLISYLLPRWLFKANRSEAVVGLFTFAISSLIILTVIGIYFRGPNMALILPF